MTPNELMWRVARDVWFPGGAPALAAAWLGGTAGAVGAAAGVGLAIGNFRWLVARVRSSSGDGDAARALWSIAAGFRFLAFGAVCAALLGTGWAHPVALVAGLT